MQTRKTPEFGAGKFRCPGNLEILRLQTLNTSATGGYYLKQKESQNPAVSQLCELTPNASDVRAAWRFYSAGGTDTYQLYIVENVSTGGYLSATTAANDLQLVVSPPNGNRTRWLVSFSQSGDFAGLLKLYFHDQNDRTWYVKSNINGETQVYEAITEECDTTHGTIFWLTAAL